MDKEIEKKMVSEFSNDIKSTIRGYAVDMLNNGLINGYLAFDNNLSIGWCNAGDINSYSQFISSFARENCLEKTFSVVCFEIAPSYRGQGIATAFLNRICIDAKEKGYQAVEGYAKLRRESTSFDYNGPTRLYEKAGFIEVLRNDSQVIMRKIL
jgi:GNAT superfamily N-acetyltransferase